MLLSLNTFGVVCFSRKPLLTIESLTYASSNSISAGHFVSVSILFAEIYHIEVETLLLVSFESPEAPQCWIIAKYRN